jgi:predicted RNA-binding protein associated with RNAse of E/G family
VVDVDRVVAIQVLVRPAAESDRQEYARHRNDGHALDVVIDPDETWHWKDEDDFAEAQQLGVFTPEQAAAVRQEGERVISQQLWITGWEHWRPA